MRRRTRLFTCLLISLCIFGNAVMAFPQFDEKKFEEKFGNKYKKGFYLFIGSGGNVVWNINMYTVSNVPEYIRNVPAHPDDEWAQNRIAPIEDAKLNYSPVSINLNALAGIGYDFGAFDLMLGGNLDWCIAAGGGSSIKRRNYTNAPGTEQRGYGAALTYYGLGKGYAHGWSAFTPGLFFRLSREVSFESDFSLFLEYSLDFYSLHLENGWDRYDSLETWKIYKLADIKKNTIKFGLSIYNNIEFFIGYTIPNSNLTPLGKITNLKIGPCLTIGFIAKNIFKKKI